MPVILPSTVSDVIRVYPKVKASMIYTSTNAPPPYFAARYGNLQILPRPTAEPAVARTYPSEPENLLLLSFVFVILFYLINFR